MSLFQLRSIEELEAEGAIVAIQDGNHGEKHPKATDYVPEGIPFVMANNLSGGFVDLVGCNKISRGQAEKLRIGFAKSGDVLLTHKGTIGSVAVLGTVDPYVMLTPQVTYYRVCEEKLSREYLSYAFREPSFQANMKSQAQQSTRPYIGITAQRRLKVKWCERRLQDKIAGVISKYDQLIENNRRRIELLEEAARLLYREWFVHFRFPGHEHVEVVDAVPEGWTEMSASGAVEINPKTAWVRDRSIRMLPMSALSETSMVVDVSVQEERAKPTGVRFSNGDTLFAWITPCLENGKTGYVDFLAPDEVACGSTEFIVLRERAVSRYFVYLLSREESFRDNAIVSMVGSSGRQRVQPSCFSKYRLAVPPEGIARSFDDIVAPIFSQIQKLHIQSAQLKAARDFLLPRLMDGRLEV